MIRRFRFEVFAVLAVVWIVSAWPMAASAQGSGQASGLALGLASGPMSETEDLIGVYRLALDADPRLRRQQFEVDALREQRREDLARLLPSVSLSGDVSRTRRDQIQSGLTGEDELTRDFTRSSYRIGLRQPLYDGPARYRLRVGDSEVDRGLAQLEAERQVLVARVAEAYLNALGAQSAVELSRRELAAIEASRERVEALYEERMAALTDLEEIRARRDRTHASLIRAEGDLVVALERLAEITDSPHERLAPLNAGAELPALYTDGGEVWIERALTENPEIRAARQRVESSDMQIRAARAQHHPNLDLVASYSYLDDLDGTPFGRKLEDLAVGVELRIPLYAGGGIRAGVRGAQSLRERDRESLEEVRRRVRAEVRTAYHALQIGRTEIQALQQAVRSSERGLEAVETGLQVGLRTVVDVLDAQRDLFGTRRELVQARHEYVLNFLALKRAAGVLDEQDILTINDLLAR